MKVKNLLLATLLPLSVFASHDHNGLDKNDDPNLKTFITNSKRVSNSDLQLKFSQQIAWKNFSEQNGGWTATFNEETGLPHNAYGTPVNMGLQLDAQSTAWGFISTKLAELQLPMGDLVFRNTAYNQKYSYVNYTQQYNGVEILWSRLQVKVTPDGRIPQFLMNVYNDINLNTQPSLSATAAQSAATAGLGYIINNITQPALKIIAVPVSGKNEYHLVYELSVRVTDNESFPRDYYSLIDAHSGRIMYRQNKINSIAATDVTVTGTVYPTHMYNPTAVEPLPNMFITVNASPFATDANGYLGLPNSAPVTATLRLEGTWCDITTNGVTPQFTATLNPGSAGNNLVFNAANIKELSAYNSVNRVHDYYVTTLMGTGAESVMDFTMNTLIDVAGSCNAFYDGNLNFFDAGGNNCGATSIINDVVYHEYGHGINYELYTFHGGFFGNGALGEGYADTWANGLTQDPVLGIGFYDNDPSGFVRRYDQDRKVYPGDLQGEVHADGEIIAGAWWDVALNFGNNFVQRQELFAATFAATLDEPSGSEGQLYHDVLIEALTIDDNDGNLANGTPNYCAITSAFALHGINVFSVGPVINHTEALASAGQLSIPINVSSPVSFSGATGTAVNGYYRTSGNAAWSPFSLSFNGSVFQGNIPAQPNGTIVQYYVDANDQCNTHFNTLPKGADATNANLPYYILVGYNLLQSDYFNTGNSNGWTEGIPSDQAATGMWDIVSPIPSIVDPNAAVLSYVQTPNDHSPTPNNICAVTGNAANSTAGIGDQDIDGGATTLISPVYDLTTYQNPAITYWRWYSNDQGATPGTDFWQVSISNDGVNYVPIENTNVADHSWRRFAFRVSDYVTPNSTITVKFVAEDAGQGSLVEGAMDDFEIWDSEPLSINENNSIASWYAYPNPVKEQLSFGWKGNSKNVKVQLTDNLGQVVYTEIFNNESAYHGVLSTKTFANGVYTLQLSGDNFIQTKKITVLK